MDALLTLALVTQVVTEAVARLYPRHTLYLACIVGVTLAALTKTGLFAALAAPGVWAPADWVLAGLVVSSGAGLVHSLKTGIRGRKQS